MRIRTRNTWRVALVVASLAVIVSRFATTSAADPHSKKEDKWTADHPGAEHPFELVRFEIQVADIETSLDSYHKLGFVLASFTNGEGGKYSEADMKAGVARLGLTRGAVATDAERSARKQFRMVFYLSDGPAALDDFRSELIRRGMKPSTVFDHGTLRQFTLEDPDGYVVSFQTNAQ